MKIGQDLPLPLAKCTGCGELVNDATSVDKDGAAPGGGDVTICIFCGHVMIYNDDLSMREPTGDEMRELFNDPRIVEASRMRAQVMPKRTKNN